MLNINISLCIHLRFNFLRKLIALKTLYIVGTLLSRYLIDLRLYYLIPCRGIVFLIFGSFLENPGNLRNMYRFFKKGFYL